MRKFFVVVTAVLMAVALVTMGCGNTAEVSTGGAGGSGDGGGAQLSNPDDVFKSVRDGVQNLKGAAYVADLEMTGVPDPAATADPTSQLAQNLKVHAEGAFSKDGMAAQMKIDLTVSGQTINAEIKANEGGVYVGLAGKWYQVPADQTEQFKQFATMSPTDLTGKLGINVDDLSSQRTLQGTETIDGAQCYHVIGKPDPAQVAQGIIDALASPELKNETDKAASQLSVDPAEAQKLKDIIKSIEVEYWVDAQTGFVRKGIVTIKLERAPDDTESGMKSADIKITFTASKFNEPVTVEAPPSPLPFDQIGEALMGGGMGGTTP